MLKYYNPRLNQVKPYIQSANQTNALSYEKMLEEKFYKFLNWRMKIKYCKHKRGYKFHYEELWSTKDMIQYNSAASQKESKTENQEIAEAAISLCCYLGNAFCQKKKKKRMKTKIESKEAIVQTKFHAAPQPISKLMKFKQSQQLYPAFCQLATSVASLTHSSVQYVPTGHRWVYLTKSRFLRHPCLCPIILKIE